MSEWAAPVDAAVLERLVVVSPHLDDAVLGCGQLLAAHPGATVVTVTARTPPAYPDPVNDWDAAGGFGPGDDVMAARRAEDAAALAVLGATPVWLDFDQFAYRHRGQPHDPADVAPALEAALVAAGPTAVFVPFGLGNPDHAMTHEAARLVLERHPSDWAWFCYEDGGYKHIPGLLARRIAELFARRIWPTPAVLAVDPSLAAKRAALACYTSQLPPLDRDHRLAERLDAAVPEQHWRLAPPPPGWDHPVA
jgi:LmbE family N-acetylglucosaminyl deacetylase